MQSMRMWATLDYSDAERPASRRHQRRIRTKTSRVLAPKKLMRLENTTPYEDQIVGKAEDFDPAELIEVIQNLDEKLTESLETIQDMERELEDLKGE